MTSPLTVGATYNWKHDPGTRLIYLGKNWSGNGYWHQFSLVAGLPREVWCEVLDHDLNMIEPSDSAPQKLEQPS